jgi:two-component system, OmpR family, sensor histidine kinase KdpD
MATAYPVDRGHARGQLRLYLGAAPGVGKTYAMLAEGQRRRSRGTDVVGALIETHGRRLTAEMAEGLEIVPRRTMNHRGATLTEMDLDAVLARHPRVALVDELAHTNAPGSRNAKRWQDVDELLDAGIDVITTLNIQHLESLSTVARQVTGVVQRETIPDDIARRADQIELVDMTPEALRRRMVHGNVYPPNRIEAALTHYFRPGNLTALRELALLWVADRVEEGMQRYRAEHGIAAPWETRERIVVGIAGEQGDEAVIRRAARIAARTPGSDLLAVHVDRDDGLTGTDESLQTQRTLVASVGGSFQQIPGEDIPETLLRFAQAENATQIVLGASLRGRLLTLLSGRSIPTRVARRAGHIDVHLVSRDKTATGGWSRDLSLAGGRSRRLQARRASVEAAALTRLAAAALRGHGDPPALLEEIRQMFGLPAVSLLERRSDGAGYDVVASAGERPPEGPGADVEVPVDATMTLAARGHVASGEDLRVLSSCAAQIVAAVSSRRRADQDAEAAWHAADLRSRTALLAATGEAAREQLAAARTALTTLAASEENRAELTPGDRVRLIAEAARAVDGVSRLVDDLRDLSRLHAGALETYLRPVDLDELLAAALDDLGPGRQEVTLSLAENLPDVIGDATLLTRLLTSLLADSVHRCPAGPPPILTASCPNGQVEICIADQGPEERGAAPSLALRLATDLAEAMGITLRCEPTPAGGRTVIVNLPAVARPPAAPPAPARYPDDDELQLTSWGNDEPRRGRGRTA